MTIPSNSDQARERALEEIRRRSEVMVASQRLFDIQDLRRRRRRLPDPPYGPFDDAA
jgi:hypothetical protein